MMAPGPVAPPVRVVLVTGLSGAGKASVLRALEDLGYETVDNPPLEMLETLVRDECNRAEEKPSDKAATARPPLGLAIGIDARSRGFDAGEVTAVVTRLKALPGVELELVYMQADDAILMGRYTETRRRHPLAPRGRVADGITAERGLTERLRAGADLLIDTTDLIPGDLRQLVSEKFGAGANSKLAVSIISFAFPRGLPRDADMVLDARFLRNPYYDPTLRPGTGLEPAVARFVEADPDFGPFMQRITDLLHFLLPRFVREGKKYATIAVGCTGGRHRSVHIAEKLARALCGVAEGERGFNVSVTHRELGIGTHDNVPLGFVRHNQIVGVDHPETGEDATDCIRHRSPVTTL